MRKITKNSRHTQINVADSSEKSIDLSGLYLGAAIRIQSVDREGENIDIYAHGSQDYGICPYCGKISRRVHSYYLRHMTDLPILGKTTRLHLEMRKFYCANPECRRKTFAEQPGIEVFRYRRRTCRCERLVSNIGLNCNSGVACRSIRATGIPISRYTILRDIHRMRMTEHPDVTQIGVDDWAFRKGLTYGSVIVNYGTNQVIDLLPDRTKETFKTWMDQHPDIELVSRDRSTDYSRAIADTGRPITEVADRFHLIKNMSDCASAIISENYEEYRKAATKEPPSKNKFDIVREPRYNRVKELQSQGKTAIEIVKMTKISEPTVRLYMRWEAFQPHKTQDKVDYSQYQKFVEQEYAKGHSLLQIFKDHFANTEFTQGTFYHYFHYLSDGHRGPRKDSLATQNQLVQERRRDLPLLTVQKLTQLMERSILGRSLEPEELKIIKTLQQMDWFKTLYSCAYEFRTIIMGHTVTHLTDWIKKYESTTIARLQQLIKGIKLDITAIENSIRYPISNGRVEGFVNKIKMVKRTMYGRAGLNLLKRKLVLNYVFTN